MRAFGTRGVALPLALSLVAVCAPVADAAKRKSKPHPINATLTVDQARAASANITAAAGGKVVVTARNGTKMTVTFPSGAMLEDTVVTATPVTRLASRYTRKGMLAGVQLQPEGLQHLKPATVRFARRGKAKKRTHMVFVGS